MYYNKIKQRKVLYLITIKMIQVGRLQRLVRHQILIRGTGYPGGKAVEG